MASPFRPLLAPLLAPALLLVATLGGGAPVARAEDAPLPPPPAGAPVAAPDALVVPVLGGLALNGQPAEPAWEKALRLSADPLEVPAPPPGTERVRLTPDVRLAQSEGLLWIAVRMAEDPGMGMGLRVLVAPEEVASAAAAVGLVYAPLELRGPRFTVRGPRGLTRAVVRLQGAADTRSLGVWSLEVAFPLADLALPGPGTRLRLALAIDSRTSNVGSAAPEGALFAEPARWALLAPEQGAWSAGSGPDPAPLLEEDARDAERVEAWRAFQEGQLTNVPAGGAEAARAHVESRLIGPLKRIEALRPDLRPYTLWVAGQVLASLGDIEQAERCYREALAAMPGCREAAFELYVKLMAHAYVEGLPEQPSDYDAALSRLALDLRSAVNPYAREGLALARGLLLYKRGDFADAVTFLEPVARRYPHDVEAGYNLERARASAESWAGELLLRKAEDARGDLPRVRLTTSKGPVLLELYEDDAPNTVKNFVWLCERGFYDGTSFHRNVPFFVLQGGDPFTKPGADARWVGGGGPGYAIPTEPGTEQRRRGAFRGTLAMASHDRDTEGSQFFLTLGTARHLDGQVSVFGRILEGQAVADALVEGDRLVKTEVLRRRPGTEYRPVTLAGEPAPEPVPTPPPSRPPPPGRQPPR